MIGRLPDNPPGQGSGKEEEWSALRTIYFWDSRAPLDVKYWVENVVGTLLFREVDKERKTRLMYAGLRYPPSLGYRLQLRLETAYPQGNWYSLTVIAWVPRTWKSEEDFASGAKRAFEYWEGKLGGSFSVPPMEARSPDLYDQRVDEAIERETVLANQREDPLPIRQIQMAILEGLRKGKSFRTAHHEGGTRMFFDGKNFVKENYGEDQSRKGLSTDEEMLECLREFYDWESRRETFPHRPPEVEVWGFIKRQLLD